jgi:hypothetical protein
MTPNHFSPITNHQSLITFPLSSPTMTLYQLDPSPALVPQEQARSTNMAVHQ